MNWVVIKALNTLYQNKEIKLNKTINSSPVFKNHEQALEIKRGRKHYFTLSDFDSVYERNYLENYQQYHNFLTEKGFLKPQLKFEELDILILMELDEKIKNNSLIPSRQQLINAQETVRGFSLMFFKNDKYLDRKPSLVQAINQILNIELVENKDQQYLYVLQCENPKLIVLCENLDFLKKDKLPRKNNYELWYAGGRNIPKLKYTNEIRRGLPIYYSADWDKDGLEIYELAKDLIPDLKLLHPNGTPRSIEETDHKSQWNYMHAPELMSGLSAELYTQRDKEKIKKLIQNNQWIVEEGNDLKVMIEGVE